MFDANGKATNNFKVNDKTEPYFYFEAEYNQDLNNDNIIGKGQATLESNGDESVVYNEYGSVAVFDGTSNKVIKDQYGYQVNKQIGDYSLVEAETDAQGLNWVVYKNSNNAVDVWVMNENWTKTNSFAAESSASNFSDIESAFSRI